MRPLLALALALSLAPVLAAPTAPAAHVGPCWHEYAEALLAGPKTFLQTAGGCIRDTPCWIVNCSLP